MQKKGPNCQRNGGLSQWKCGFDQSQLRSLSWRFFANSHVTQSKIMFSLVIETFDASCKWQHIMYCIRMLSSPDKHNLARYPDRQKDNLTKHNTHDISVHRRFFFYLAVAWTSTGTRCSDMDQMSKPSIHQMFIMRSPVLGLLMSLDVNSSSWFSISGGFLKWWYPKQSFVLDWDFPLPTSYWGTPMTMEPPI